MNNLFRPCAQGGTQPKANMAKKNHSITTNTDTGNRTRQTFSFSAPGATSVQLVGDFTHWQQQPIQMRRGAGGVWHATVELTPGAHHYRFLVDGQWRDDPDCAVHVPNPYGGRNAVRQVA